VASAEEPNGTEGRREPRLTLRARLILTVAALAAAGLVVAMGVTYVSLRSFLVERVDDQLLGARVPVAMALAVPGDLSQLPRPPMDGGGGGGGGPTMVPPGTYGELRDGSGTVLDTMVFAYGETAPRPPDLPADLPTTTIAGGAKDKLMTVGAQNGGGLHYRVLATRLPTLDRVLVVAIPLTEVDRTLTRLLVVELIVSAGVLALLAGATWVLVRRELKPLDAMAADAAAIASGDLSRRVERAGPRTEVGRLGLALNAMLKEIEEAFAEKQASEDRLRRFLADASHELRTPLTSIRGYSELFRRGVEERPEDRAVAMRRVEEEASRMGVIVDELLLLARLDQGRPLEREPVDLAGVAHDAVRDACAADPGREITFAEPDEAKAGVVVTGDQGRLRQVAGNLVGNALEHTPAGTPVEVRVAIAGDEALLEVSDHGGGLGEDEARQVFEPFYRSAEARGEAAGAGLGLAIVEAIAEAHGGRAEVVSVPGEGATFRVRLPLAEAGERPVDAEE
jgi:two-component system OmpR family sensor kinase